MITIDEVFDHYLFDPLNTKSRMNLIRDVVAWNNRSESNLTEQQLAKLIYDFIGGPHKAGERLVRRVEIILSNLQDTK
ncbi:hypothetical protein PHIN3_142 [Sinorhizobium phage phiN3]|uniref:Uncharacterized protein n=1 Tax=Sinorhizobium phage phiN3 TaxID=1647405 RepID=A0A0F6WCT7_9CAUD|nr:hypothetical protein AVT40_gp391 [Sinorhizobium phage phiN3]AKF13405.1 hypothetical protein PHIN3_142 [Sinorhizobium phage phiN3]